MKPSKQVAQMRRKWVNKQIHCFTRNFNNSRTGPYIGKVIGLMTNEAAMEAEGGETYEATGLMVEIKEIGSNPVFGEWPIRFTDAITR